MLDVSGHSTSMLLIPDTLNSSGALNQSANDKKNYLEHNQLEKNDGCFNNPDDQNDAAGKAIRFNKTLSRPENSFQNRKLRWKKACIA